MSQIRHGQIPTWYSKESKDYDLFNENTPNSKITNTTIEKILKKYKVETVLDLTCGTGSQVFWLVNRGYDVTGIDINPGMLKVAKHKARKAHVKIKLLQGDMRTSQVGKFDAAITIFNAIGHLTKADFEKTVCNIYKNLNDGGIYIFDIFNLNYFQQADNITKLTIDWIRTKENSQNRIIQYSVINNEGILISYTVDCSKKKSANPTIENSIQTLQLYPAAELRKMLMQNGFKVLGQYSIDGSKFSAKKTERIMTIARKV